MSDAGDALDAAGGLLGVAVLGGVALMGMKMMGDMAKGMTQQESPQVKNQRVNQTRIKPQNTLNFGGPQPRKEQKSFNPPKPAYQPMHNVYPPPSNDFFSPEIPNRQKTKKQQKEWWEWDD